MIGRATINWSVKQLSIRDYDFDEFSLFTISLMIQLKDYAPKTTVRWSSSNYGIHIRTSVDLDKFQCQNRAYWSMRYGYDITFKTKKGKSVSKWYRIDFFLNLFLEFLLRKAITPKEIDSD